MTRKHNCWIKSENWHDVINLAPLDTIWCQLLDTISKKLPKLTQPYYNCHLTTISTKTNIVVNRLSLYKQINCCVWFQHLATSSHNINSKPTGQGLTYGLLGILLQFHSSMNCGESSAMSIQFLLPQVNVVSQITFPLDEILIDLLIWIWLFHVALIFILLIMEIPMHWCFILIVSNHVFTCHQIAFIKTCSFFRKRSTKFSNFLTEYCLYGMILLQLLIISLLRPSSNLKHVILCWNTRKERCLSLALSCGRSSPTKTLALTHCMKKLKLRGRLAVHWNQGCNFQLVIHSLHGSDLSFMIVGISILC